MGRCRMTMLSRDEIDAVHAASLRILGTTGALVGSEEARGLLVRAGAEASEGERIVFPESLVADALRRAPRSFVLGARDRAHDVRLPANGFPYVCTDGFPVKVWDHATQAPRVSTRADLVRWATLADALPAVDFFWPSTTPTDLPAHLQFLGGLRTSYEYTTKHVQYQALRRDEAVFEIEMSRAVAGGEDADRPRPHVSSVHCVVAPLQYDAGPTDAQVEFARAGVPVVAMSMVSPGITGPATLAGSLALANAEVLGSLVISQLARAGAPFVTCFVCAPLDMRSGGFLMGAPEFAVLSVAGAELARSYGLPSMMGALGNTGKSHGIQLGYEKAATTAAVALAGPDLLVGLGGLNDSLFVSMEQLLIDAEIWEHVRRTADGIEVSEAELALDVIARVGSRGHYLRDPHTLANFRRLFAPRYSDHAPYDTWAARGRREMYDVAHVDVDRILASHVPDPLPDDVRRALAEIESRAAKALA